MLQSKSAKVEGMEPVIRVRNLVKRYKDVVAVNGLDLDVMPGECFGLLGPNGAGKTTTVEILEGLTVPDEGTVEILGRAWKGKGGRLLRARLGVALQETRLPDKLTVRETIRLFRSFYSKGARGREVGEVLELMGLTVKADARVEKLSGGQRQRLALATALVGSPEILFLDEPTTGLDPQARLRIWEVVDRFKEDGGTVCLTTHYMDEAAHLCDRVLIMDQGKRIALDSPRGLVASLDRQEVVEVREATLEDVFVHMTGKGLRDG